MDIEVAAEATSRGPSSHSWLLQNPIVCYNTEGIRVVYWSYSYLSRDGLNPLLCTSIILYEMEDSLPPKNGGKAKAGLETSFACCFWQPVSKVIQLSIFWSLYGWSNLEGSFRKYFLELHSDFFEIVKFRFKKKFWYTVGFPWLSSFNIQTFLVLKFLVTS